MSSPPEGRPKSKTIPHPLSQSPVNNGAADENDNSKNESKNPYYLDLIESTKQQMSKKFDQLEKENGLDFRVIPTFAAQNATSNNNNHVGHHQTHNQNLEHLKLEKENKHLKEELRLKDDIIEKMFKIRSQVESELEDLTASLFEEANKMVYKANVSRERLDKDLFEANLKIDMLTAEVQALKLLVITSTPSMKPNNNNNNNVPPQLSSPKKRVTRALSQNFPTKSPSNYELGATTKENNGAQQQTEGDLVDALFPPGPSSINNHQETGEIDPVLYQEFVEWRKSPCLEPMNSNFMKRIYDEEIYPVFNFKNKNLTSAVIRAIENNTLTMEMLINGGEKLPFPKKCALLELQRLCHYRMRLGENETWYSISHLSRNRIANVCDLFCYLRYIKNGLVKSSDREMYWQIMTKRKKIAASKLGFLNNNNNNSSL